MARIIEGDQRRGARLDLMIDLVPRLSPSMVPPPEFIVTHKQKLQWNSEGVGGREGTLTQPPLWHSFLLRNRKGTVFMSDRV